MSSFTPKNITFRALTADDVEARIGNVPKSGKGLSLLLYKTARTDMNVLDETVGQRNWQRKHYEQKGNMFCSVSINVNFANEDAPPLWIEKDDCGEESNVSKEKGESSDAFKRACTNWGIGRELYTSPFIWVAADKCNLEGGQGKYTCADKFRVTELQSKAGTITDLVVYNESRRAQCYEYHGGKNKTTTPAVKEPEYYVEKAVEGEDGKLIALSVRKTATNKRVYVWQKPETESKQETPTETPQESANEWQVSEPKPPASQE